MFNHDTHHTPIGALHVAELARLAEVTPATVRYYSRIGLLSPKREPENGYRYYSVADQHRLNFIRRAQSLGLTIGDIKTILGSIDKGEVPCDQVRALVEGRLQSVEEQLVQLKATKMRITQALAFWDVMPVESPAIGGLCPLIDRVDAVETPATTGAPHRTQSRGTGNNRLASVHC